MNAPQLVDLNHDGKVSLAEKAIAVGAGFAMLAGTVLLGALVAGMLGACGG